MSQAIGVEDGGRLAGGQMEAKAYRGGPAQATAIGQPGSPVGAVLAETLGTLQACHEQMNELEGIVNGPEPKTSPDLAAPGPGLQAVATELLEGVLMMQKRLAALRAQL